MLENIRSDIQFLKRHENAFIYVKREDCIPFSFGGNKVRIGAELMSEAERAGCDHIISYGSEASNLNRVMAHMAENRGMGCTVIIKRDSAKEKSAHFNELMLKNSRAHLVYCTRDSVRETVEEELSTLTASGHKPYYVYGNSMGTGNEDVFLRAYEKAFLEIREYEKEKEISFDHIFTASGTGMTQAGLIAGKLSTGSRVEITGISVARQKEALKASILSALKSAGFGQAREDMVSVSDDYLCGGYGSYDSDIRSVVWELMTDHGIPSDPCYSAKGFAGMLRELERKGIEGNVLFIHTGGTPGFFDLISGGNGRHGF